jgi:hypothetical protein
MERETAARERVDGRRRKGIQEEVGKEIKVSALFLSQFSLVITAV